MNMQAKVQNLMVGIGLTLALLPSPGRADGLHDWLYLPGDDAKDAKPWSVNIGTRVWMDEWDGNLKQPDVSLVFGSSNSPQQLHSTTHEATAIPFGSLRYGRFVVNGSYYADTDFTFVDNKATYNNLLTGQLGVYALNQAAQAQRSEWDVSLGYMIGSYFQLAVGYKEINFSVNHSESLLIRGVPYVPPYPTAYTDTNQFSGPTIGFYGTVPIAGGFDIYATYAHGFMNYNYSSLITGQPVTSKDDSANYDQGELGIKYNFRIDKNDTSKIPVSEIIISAGYRYQRLSYSYTFKNISGVELAKQPNSFFQNIANASDTTQGFVAGISFGF